MVEWNIRSAVSSSPAAKVASCAKTSVFCAVRTACGQALVSPKMATSRPFLGGERDALPSIVLPSSKLTVSLFSDGLSAATTATAGMCVLGFQIFGTWRSGRTGLFEAVEIVLPKRVLIVRQSVEIVPIVKAAVVAV